MTQSSRTDGPMDQRTNGRTNRRTDRPTKRGVESRAHDLKITDIVVEVVKVEISHRYLKEVKVNYSNNVSGRE